ncbi:MAG TPA: DnaA regulatory inactivator Hda [Burkholderiaceae bacterium]|nr:DnaA regulatory inactivator Hda [Burkholderiaceae bacterium]
MNAPRQLTLDLLRPLTPSLDNFVVGRNAEALASLRAVAGARQDGFVYLWGEPGSGRSHLLTALAAGRPAAMSAEGDAIPEFSDPQRLYLVDDVDARDAPSQQRVFVLMNEVRAHPGAALVATGRAAPAQLALRDDVRTRLAWGLVYQVHALSDDEKAQALAEQARSRGLTLSPDVIAYLLSHMPRDMRTLVAILDALDGYALAAKRAITVPLVREWAQAAA